MARGKFLEFDAGTIFGVREDTYGADGNIAQSRTTGDLMIVMSVKRYPTFRAMLEAEGLQHVLPGSIDIDACLTVYRRFYSEADEREHGVLALRIEPWEDPDFPTD